MRDRLIELFCEVNKTCAKTKDCSNCVGYEKGVYCKHYLLADHLLAEGVIVPPCKVGDTVWVNWEKFKSKKETRPVKVYALRFDTKKNSMRICVEGDFEISAYGGSYTHYYKGTFAWNSVGKTVFLTREEAERALERSENGK